MVSRVTFWKDGQLAGLGLGQPSFHADEIADIELGKQFVGLGSDIIFFDVQLNSAGAILDIAKGGLAVFAPGHNASRDDVFAWRFFKFLFGELVELVCQISDEGVDLEPVDIGVDPFFAKLSDFVAAQLEQVCGFFHEMVVCRGFGCRLDDH